MISQRYNRVLSSLKAGKWWERAGLKVGVLFLIFSMILFSAQAVHAEKATPAEMEEVCQNWLTYMVAAKGSWAGSTDPRIDKATPIIENDTLVGMCFSILPQGYVIVPVLKELPPVKACSDESNLDVYKPQGFAKMIREVLQDRVRTFVKVYGSMDATQPMSGYEPLGQEYKPQWSFFAVAPKTFSASFNKSTRIPLDEVGPLLTTSWHQGSPYNDDCPLGDGGRCVTGCVATAAAQIMAYHQWPPAGNGSHSYYWNGDNSCGGSTPGQTLSADFSDEYDWANIPDDCPPNCTPAEEAALAELNYEVGVAFEMDYGFCGSGIYQSDIPYCMSAFETHFRYLDQMVEVIRTGYNSTDWFNMIKNEINANRPIWYFMTGHSVVCDGWREIGDPIVKQYHMNYGWDDGHNTWYTLDNYYCPMDPDPCYQSNEVMVLYIEPDRGIMFEADTTFGWVPFEVNFTGTSQYSVDSWMWDFGDGTGDTVTVETVTHVYETPGMFDVSLVIDTGGDTLAMARNDYVIALADTLRAEDILAGVNTTVEMTIYAKNVLPMDRVVIPVEFSGSLNITYDSFSTAGCRTSYFETQSYLHFNPNYGQITIKLETTSSELPAGEGAVLKLYFSVPWAPPTDSALIEVDGYSSYLPEFSGSVATYAPYPKAGVIHVSCCSGIRGNADGDIFDDVNVADLTFLVDYLFKGGAAPYCEAEADVDGSGGINVADLTYLVNYLFKGGSAPPSCF